MTSRTRRRCAQTRKQPSAIHYVGYVEDEEGVEMIMKKFEALEKIQEQHRLEQKQRKEAITTDSEVDVPKSDVKESATSPEISVVEDEQVVDEQFLETVFKETSHFSVNMLSDDTYNTIQNNWFDEDTWNVIDPAELHFSEDEDEFFGDPDAFWDEEYDFESDSGKKKRKIGIGNKVITRSKLVEITGQDGFVYTVKKKIKYVDPTLPSYNRIPPLPVPFSWARSFQPFYQQPDIEGTEYMELDVLKMDLKKLANNSSIQAVLVDPPWQLSTNPPTEGTVTPAMLAKMDFGHLISSGFVFLWVDKEVISSSVKMMAKHGFTYVENLVWVKQSVHNKLETQPSQYFRRSKASLLIFRKGGNLELRHQRNPDVIFDFVRNDKGLSEDKPEMVYVTIETLLPETKYEKGKPLQLIELWAKKGQRRTGWITVAQK